MISNQSPIKSSHKTFRRDCERCTSSRLKGAKVGTNAIEKTFHLINLVRKNG